MRPLIFKRPKVGFKKAFLLTSFFLVLFLSVFTVLSPDRRSSPRTLAEPNCDSPGPGDFDYCIEKIQREIEALKPAHEYNKKELANLKDQLQSLNKKISAISVQLEVLEKDIEKREEDLAYAQEIFETKTESHYKFIRLYDPLLPFLSSKNAAQVFREINFRQKAAEEDRKTMEKYAEELFQLKEDKEELERSKASLAGAQKQVDERVKFLAGEVEKVEAYIASLTAKQQNLLAARSGAFNVSLGSTSAAIPCSGRPGSSHYCNPGSNYYAAFSFGAWTHRKGMSQYGAWGRAKSGQGYEQILAHYYPGSSLQTRGDIPSTINTDQGTKNFEEDYLYGIAEMPSSWTENNLAALKAQAIAARTYALYYIGWPGGNRTICTNQGCQVYSSSKAANPPSDWKRAVDETRGQVLLGGDGRPIGAFYSSTPGGYLTTSGWDTTDGSGGDLFSKAYDNIAGSPWFYSAWYTESYLSSSAKCGRSHPWLNSEEMADILNAYIVLRNSSDDRIIPETIGSCPISGVSGNPYSKTELRNRAAEFETPITSVTGVTTATIGGDGRTVSLTFQTNRGPFTVDGADFKTAFNLRAPGYIAIRSPMFNVERSN